MIATSARKISFLHLANDVVQTSRRKSEDLVKEFGKIFPDAFVHIYRYAEYSSRDRYCHVGISFVSTIVTLKAEIQPLNRSVPPDAQNKVARVLQVFEDRAVYSTEYLDEIRKSLNIPTLAGQNRARSASVMPSGLPQEARSIVPLLSSIEKQMGATTALTIETQRLPIEWFQTDLCTVYTEQNRRNEAIGALADAKKKLEALKNTSAAELKDRRLLATELQRLLQANELSISGASATLQQTETQLAVVDVQLGNLRYAAGNSPTLPVSHAGTPELQNDPTSTTAATGHSNPNETPYYGWNGAAVSEQPWSTPDGLLSGGDLNGTLQWNQ
ncbi:hypothetical protein SmJEL517_g02524 [Synchytrium microbalum]|uniref:CID domain-containing protein n=1 Tax=Synchytrium microbalum TaxID=1806994 RepID=A0A507C0M8_9FUNG|nr:uncharacterized protein SmJEL517_g02524 [Synchytrium microbalum]TPX35090.1 hypothetical protein SmJEL517_g02524 [Synchytrium microbalum]